MNICKTERKTRILGVRVTPSFYSKLEAMADMYADGDFSEWVRHCLENYQPKIVKGKKKKKKRGYSPK